RRASVSATASSFAVLANAAVTCTNGTITGDVGTYLNPPTGSVTQTICPVIGTVHVGAAAAKAAYNAFVAAYEAMKVLPTNPPCTVLTGTLAGVTLAPGVYCFDAAAALTGVLTLSGPSNGTWTFLIGTSGTGALTGTNFSVVMEGGALPCNVTWWVAQAATMTTSDFIGTIMAGEAITLTGGTFAGNVWSQADVTITGTKVTGCAGGSPIPGGKGKCNQGVGNGFEGCDPGNSNNHNPSNDEKGGIPGTPGRKGP
ncbi:MAG TPA: ice-binding family protein, partial [Gemmatimonadaceae bacterium]